VKRPTYRTLAEFMDGEEITQEAFADEIGISQSFLSMLLRGERQPSLPLAIKIAERAQVPIASLLARDSVERGVSQ
jgi:transcriptional regulator with XRE-family HTH domain